MQLSSPHSSGPWSYAFHLGLRVARLYHPARGLHGMRAGHPHRGSSSFDPGISSFCSCKCQDGAWDATAGPAGGHCRVCFRTGHAQPAGSWGDACEGLPASPSSGEKTPDNGGCQHQCALACCCLPKDYLGLNPGPACCCLSESGPSWLRGRSGSWQHLRGLHVVCRHRRVAPKASGSQLFPLQRPFFLGRWCYK